MAKTVSVFMDLELFDMAAGGGGPDGPTQDVLQAAKKYGRIVRAECYGREALPPSLRDCGLKFVQCFEANTDAASTLPESVAMIMAASELLYKQPTNVVFLVTDDVQIGDLAVKLRTAGSYVVVVTPEGALWNRNQVDKVLTFEDLAKGWYTPPSDVPAPQQRSPKSSRNHVTQETLNRLIEIVDGLERKMPFVGLRWLKNSILGPRSVGLETPSSKQELINRAVDEQIVETYKVDNQVAGGDQVTACRLNPKHPSVEQYRKVHPFVPAAPAEHQMRA